MQYIMLIILLFWLSPVVDIISVRFIHKDRSKRKIKATGCGDGRRCVKMCVPLDDDNRRVSVCVNCSNFEACNITRGPDDSCFQFVLDESCFSERGVNDFDGKD